MSRDHRLYLDDIVEAIDRISEYVKGMDYEAFAAAQKTIDAVVRNLEIIGEAAGHLPEPARESVPEIAWRKIIGLRNILVHEYFGISKPIIRDVVQNKLAELEAACHRLMLSGRVG